MWIPRKVYQTLQENYYKADIERGMLAQHLQAVKTSMEWLTVHVTQLEHERTILLKNYLGVTVPPLTINQVRDESGQQAVDAPNHFDDIGDEAAKKMGIEWNPLSGEVVYSERSQ